MGCRRVAPPEELVRVVRGADGRLLPGAGRPGRGAWLCRGSTACLESAHARGALARALRGPVNGPPDPALIENGARTGTD